MPLLSVWDYLRQKTRDSVLAGFQDALDVVEQDDHGHAHHQAAQKLRDRLTIPAELETSIPATATASTGQRNLTAGRIPVAHAEPVRGNSVDDSIDARLNGMA